jgi:glyoxylase I family protein
MAQYKNTTVPGCGFHHVAIKVSDYDRAAAFYQALGFTVTASWGDGAARGALLDTGDGNYVEVFAGGPATPPRPAFGSAALDAAPFIHLCFRTHDLERATQAALAAGATLSLPIKELTLNTHQGKQIPIRISFVTAPTGEVIEFFQSADL